MSFTLVICTNPDKNGILSQDIETRSNLHHVNFDDSNFIFSASPREIVS